MIQHRADLHPLCKQRRHSLVYKQDSKLNVAMAIPWRLKNVRSTNWKKSVTKNLEQLTHHHSAAIKETPCWYKKSTDTPLSHKAQPILCFWCDKHLLKGILGLSVCMSVCHTFLHICKVHTCDVIMYLLAHHSALRSCLMREASYKRVCPFVSVCVSVTCN